MRIEYYCVRRKSTSVRYINSRGEGGGGKVLIVFFLFVRNDPKIDLIRKNKKKTRTTTENDAERNSEGDGPLKKRVLRKVCLTARRNVNRNRNARNSLICRARIKRIAVWAGTHNGIRVCDENPIRISSSGETC